MPFDPDYITPKEDDCVRMSIACYLDMHPTRVPFFPPGSNNMWDKYREWTKNRFGLNIFFTQRLAETQINQFMEFNKKWIAIVKPLTLNYSKEYYIKKYNNSSIPLHAVVMKKDKLHYDPAFERTRKPKKIFYGLIIGRKISDTTEKEFIVEY